MDNSERIITMTIAGPATEGGLVPLRVLSKKLDALQSTLFNFAEAQGGGPVAQRGNWNKHVRSSCELLFNESRKGSLTILAEVPPPPTIEQITIFPDEEKDPGLKALLGLKEASQAVVTRNIRKIGELLPDSVGRGRFLKSLEELCPREEEDFTVFLGNGNGKDYAEFTIDSRNFIKKIFAEKIEEESPEVQTVSGILVEIRAFAGRKHITIKSKQKEIICYYPSEMEEQIAQLVVGSLVEVAGTVQTREDGTVSQVDNLTDVSTVDLSPFRIKAFTWQDKKYVLKEPAICNVDYEGDLWIYKVPKYALHSFAIDRREALSQLNEFFISNCEDLFDEKDENLTLDALELKNIIKEDLKEIKS